MISLRLACFVERVLIKGNRYGKVYHLWQTDRGDQLPLGEPQLMTSYTAPDQLDFDTLLGERDRRFGADHKHKAEIRGYIQEPKIHPGK